MDEMDRVLAPLQEARAAVEKLDDYATPQELAVALEAIGQAVERSLRQLLRRDASQPDDIRLNAFDTELVPMDRVVVALRQRERISLDAAHTVHELQSARVRAARGDVRAADADEAQRAVRLLSAELTGKGARASDDSLRESAHAAVARGDVETAAHEVPRNEVRSWQRRGLVLGATLVVLALLTWVVLEVVQRDDALAQGVEAFNAEQYGAAERHFKAALERDSGNADAALWLGRTLRSDQRPGEALAVLNAARKRHPDDADILREVGHLLARDLFRPAAAAEAYRRAVEVDPENTDNWVALIQALRAAGDPSAERELARAPAEVRAALTRPSARE